MWRNHHDYHDQLNNIKRLKRCLQNIGVESLLLHNFINVHKTLTTKVPSLHGCEVILNAIQNMIQIRYKRRQSKFVDFISTVSGSHQNFLFKTQWNKHWYEILNENGALK